MEDFTTCANERCSKNSAYGVDVEAYSALLSVHSICMDLHEAGNSRTDLCRPNRLIYQGHLDVSCALDDMEVCDNVALVIPEKA